MELIHRLTYNGKTTVIDEPIGFDNLKMTMKRHDYHGMGAEVSLDNLEFYGQAFNIIKQAYEADIDSEIMYTVLADSEEIYSGKIDLSTYSLKQGDYQSVSVKVGEIGVKTTFNNRLETEVDLNKCETIDGTAFDKPNWLNLHIPPKHLLYTNKLEQKNDSISKISISRYSRNTSPTTTPLLFEKVKINEFGNVNSDGLLFYTTDDFDDKFGKNTQIEISIDVEIEVTNYNVPYSSYPANHSFVIALYTENYLNVYEKHFGEFEILASNPIDGTTSYRFLYNGIVNVGSIALVVGYQTDGQTPAGKTGTIEFTMHKSSVKMTMYDNLTENDPVYADMLLTHDALNVVAQTISETALTVKSDWYRTPESKWNAGTIGGGALKALTNGYKIRGLFADEDNERNMPLSFKDLIKSLNAQDCIGWGFSTEDGETCVRVERWDWFYKSDVILTLTDVAEVQTDIDPDRIITELTIGYKKYATNDQYNSIDSPHGKATYANAIKAVSNAETQECEFVADNYAIEETRRAASGDATKETSYDEVLFVFELVKSTAGVYSIGHTAYNGTNIGNDKEFINAKLTPRHMASRWRDYIFATNNSTSFKYTAGELNNHAAFIVLPTYLNAQYSLQPFEGSSFKMEESDSLAYTHAAFQAEKITFSYPLTIAQYKTVKANPYGLVSVNGKQGWITDFKYSFADGMADFTLISKFK